MSSRSYRLQEGEGTAEGIRRIALGRAEHALEELSGAGDGNLASAVHATRKDLKKLRALVRLVRGELGKPLARAENRRYRDAGRMLSGSRDAEVKPETLAALRDRFGDELPAGDSERWARALARERDELAAVASGEVGRIDEARRAIGAGRDRILEWPLETDSRELLEPGLRRSYRQGRRAMKRTRAGPRARNVHEWRKRAKDFRYQLRIVGAPTEQMHALTDLLGEHHDLTVLAEDLARRENLGSRGSFKAAIERRQEELVAAALDLGRRLYAEKPKEFGARLTR
jgi:CHAD domain-containing protein